MTRTHELEDLNQAMLDFQNLTLNADRMALYTHQATGHYDPTFSASRRLAVAARAHLIKLLREVTV